jgi:hypothetical protein
MSLYMGTMYYFITDNQLFKLVQHNRLFVLKFDKRYKTLKITIKQC